MTETASGTNTTGDPGAVRAARKGRVAEFDQELVRDISERVYRDLLEQDNDPPGAVARMIEKDGDTGQKLRARSASYDRLTRAYLRATQS